MFDSMTEFEEYLMENSHLEFGYLWTGGKWMVSSWSREEVGFGYDADMSQLGMGSLGWLLPLFVRDERLLIV